MSWLESRKLTKGQRVKARICDFRNPERNNTVVEGTVTEDTDGFFEVFDIEDENGDMITVYYPDEVFG